MSPTAPPCLKPAGIPAQFPARCPPRSPSTRMRLSSLPQQRHPCRRRRRSATASRPVLVTTIGIMLRPEVRYARAEDGVAIAYSVAGDGPVTIVVVSPLISQLELAWEEPALEHFWSRFAACARLVLFDRRGAGLSDPSPAGQPLGLAALALDIEAVLDGSGTRQAVLLGVTFGCAIAVQFAVGYPDRVQAVILAGGFAKLTR